LQDLVTLGLALLFLDVDPRVALPGCLEDNVTSSLAGLSEVCHTELVEVCEPHVLRGRAHPRKDLIDGIAHAQTLPVQRLRLRGDKCCHLLHGGGKAVVVALGLVCPGHCTGRVAHYLLDEVFGYACLVEQVNGGMT